MIALAERGLEAKRQVPLEVRFRGVPVGNFHADLLVEDSVIVELKAVTTLTQDHKAQLINYLKVTGIDVGLLVNFGSQRLEHRRLWRPSDNAETSGHSQDV